MTDARHARDQVLQAVMAISALLLLLAIAFLLTARSAKISSAEVTPAVGPLAKVAKWVEPPRRPEPDFDELIRLITTDTPGWTQEFEGNLTVIQLGGSTLENP
jgi:hypothetical protein